jgi:hypothetical protein
MPLLDNTANNALKFRPAETLHWLVPKLDPDYAFTRWAETRLRAPPRKHGRLCDTAAELASPSGTQPPLMLVLEVQARTGPRVEGRMLEYLGRALQEFRAGPHNRDQVPVALQLSYLRGKRRNLRLRLVVPGTGQGLWWKVRVHCLEGKSAHKTLERIERDELGKTILAWITAMRGGDDPALVPRWLAQINLEPDVQLRREIAATALIWAEWLGRDTIWRNALEELDVWQSKLLNERMERARAEARAELERAHLRSVLRRRAPGGMPADLDELIDQTTDAQQLGAWFEIALDVQSLEEFRQRLSQGTNGNGPVAPPAG